MLLMMVCKLVCRHYIFLKHLLIMNKHICPYHMYSGFCNIIAYITCTWVAPLAFIVRKDSCKDGYEAQLRIDGKSTIVRYFHNGIRHHS